MVPVYTHTYTEREGEKKNIMLLQVCHVTSLIPMDDYTHPFFFCSSGKSGYEEGLLNWLSLIKDRFTLYITAILHLSITKMGRTTQRENCALALSYGISSTCWRLFFFFLLSVHKCWERNYGIGDDLLCVEHSLSYMFHIFLHHLIYK